MKKALALATLFLLIASPCWAVTYYATNGAQNWSNTTTAWDLTSSAGLNLASAAPTNAIDVIFDATYTGTMTVDNTSAVAKTVTANLLSGGILTLAGTNKLTVSGSFIINSTSTLAFAPTSTAAGALTIAATGTLTTNVTNTTGNLLSNLSLTAGTITLGDNLAFSAVKTNTLSISTAVILAIGTYTIKGQSVTNRVFMTAGTLGTPLTNGATGATTTTFNNIDLRDIKLSTAGALDISNSNANSVGDCGGSSATGGALTFTTAGTQTVTGNSANWSTATWSGRVPLPQDPVVINMTAGQTLTVDMPRLGSDLSFTTATLLALGNAVTSYGSVNLTNMSGNPSGAFSWTFESQARGGATSTLTSAGKAFNSVVTCNMFNSTLKFADAFSCAGQAFTLNNGTVDAFTNNVSVIIGNMDSNVSTTRKIKMGSTWTCTRAISFTWNFLASNGTIEPNSCILIFSDVGASNKDFNMAGLTFGAFQFYGGGAGAIRFSGGGTFASIKEAPGHLGTKTLTFTINTTTTLTGNMSAGFGNGVNLLTIKSSSAGTAATINYTFGGAINADYLDITDINVTPASTWFYGNNSTWHSGTGWKSGNSGDMFLVM